MKRYFILLLLAISALSCKKDTQPNPEVPTPPKVPLQAEALIQAKWTLKNIHYEYFNTTGVKVYSSDDTPTTGNIYQFGKATVTYGADQETATYSISTSGSKKIITINFLDPVVADIKTIDQTNLLLYSEIDSNGANTAVYHNGTLTQYTKKTILYTFNKP